MANAIAVAVKKGGGVGDPDMNFSLRLAVDNARAVNMPKENIERAIEKGMGGGAGKEIEELVLEGYGPHGTAFIIEAVTDNRNRTVSEVKNILEKTGGRLGEPGSVMYQFDIVGEVTSSGPLTSDLELQLIDVGVTDLETEGDDVHIYCEVTTLKAVSDHLLASHHHNIESKITYKPKLTIEVATAKEQVEKLIETLHEHDDVQEVSTNGIW